MSDTPTQRSSNTPELTDNQNEQFAKNRSCIVIYDRSDSMQGSMIDITESELWAFAKAYESFGGVISVIDIYENDTRRISPFESELTEDLSEFQTGEAAGSTPMTLALDEARDQIQDRRDNPFVIAITDGIANDRVAFSEALEEFPANVYGVILQHTDQEETPDWMTEQVSQYSSGTILDQPNALSMVLEQFARLDAMENSP